MATKKPAQSDKKTKSAVLAIVAFGLAALTLLGSIYVVSKISPTSFSPFSSLAAGPSVTSARLDSTSGFGLVDDDLIASWTTADSVVEIVDWVLNGVSLAVFNAPFEGGSDASSTTDYSGYGNDASVSGATWSATAGKNGHGAYAFDGQNDYLSVTDAASLDMGDEMTINLWFNPDQPYNATADYVMGLIDKGDYKVFLDKADGKLKAEVVQQMATWSTSFDGSTEFVHSLAVYDGKLYAGLGSAGGSGDVYVFDGSSWSLSHDGASNSIRALAVYNNKLYAGQDGGAGEGDVLVFDGSAWSTSYDGATAGIFSLGVYNNKLYAGLGSALGAGDIYEFDGSSWSLSFDGNQLEVVSLAVYNGKLYAGQRGNIAGGDIVVFDGSSWSSSYDGSQEAIWALAVYNNKLYAGQGTGSGDGDVLVFDGSAWTTSYDGATEESILSLAVYGDKLYAGTGSGESGGVARGNVLAFDGTTWSMNFDGHGDEIPALAVYNDKLYAGRGYNAGFGDVIVLDSATLPSTDSLWSVSYDGATSNIFSLGVYNGKLYAGSGDGAGEGDVLVYDGSTWSVSYDGAANEIKALAVYDGKLYAGQGNSAGNGDVLVYDGSTWSVSYDGAQEEIYSLAVYNGKLYAGQGSTAGDSDVYVFDGSSWTLSYDGATNDVTSMAVYNNKLYAGFGYGAGAGDIYVFDGSSWTLSYDSAFQEANDLAVYDGKLYAAQGYSSGMGDIVVFDGSTWSTSYDGAEDEILSLAVYDGKLYAGQGYTEYDLLVFDGNTWSTSYEGAYGYIMAQAVYDGKLYFGQAWDGGSDGDVFEFDAGDGVASTTSSYSGWNLATLVKDASSLKLYVNGTLENTTAWDKAVTPGLKNLVLGKLYGKRAEGTGPGTFAGKLDDVAIYDRALTPEQITEVYNNGNAENGTATIVSQETSLNDEWQACVTPNNGSADGAEVCSNTLTIGAGNDVIQSLSADNPIAQAIAVSQQRFPTPGSASCAVISRDNLLVDSFVVAPLATLGNCTVLLTESQDLNLTTKAEIDRALNDPSKTLYLAGGTEALEPAVAQALEQGNYPNIIRFDGANRRQTARLIADQIVADNSEALTTVVITEDQELVDAFAITSVAGIAVDNQVEPILINKRKDGSMDPNIAEFLQANPGITKALIIGGTEAISAAFTDKLAADYPQIEQVRYAGDNRYHTNALIVEEFFPQPLALYVAPGDKNSILAVSAATSGGTLGPDNALFSALMAGTIAADKRSPLVLVAPDSVPEPIAQYIQAHASTIEFAFTVSFRGDIAQAVIDALRDLITQ